MRAQFWSFDIIFAIVVFSSAVVILSLVWSGISSQYSLSYGLGPLTLQTQLQGLQSTVLGPGSPSNWNSRLNVSNTMTWSNITVGLGNGNGTSLSQGKILTLMAMSDSNTVSYQATKALLGVGYEYYIVINDSNMLMSFGSSPSNKKATAMQVATQSATLNGAPVSVRIILWTNKTLGVS